MLQCCLFFATSRVSELARIVTAIKFSKISAGADPPCKISGEGGRLEPLTMLLTLQNQLNI